MPRTRNTNNLRRRKTPRLTRPPKKRQQSSPQVRDRNRDKTKANNDAMEMEMMEEDEMEVDEMERRRPSPEEFAKWTARFRSFAVKDKNNEPVIFQVGGYGLIVPPHPNRHFPEFIHEYWVGQIVEIRSKEHDPSEVWTKVHWLWSGSEVAAENKSLTFTTFGRMERLRSKLSDFVHSSCFQDIALVVNFDDRSADPPLITDETFYVRYTFDIYKKTIKPKMSSTCLCGVPYNPDISSPMHFCPRKKCFKAYHASCLRGTGRTHKLPPSQAAHEPLNSQTTHRTRKNSTRSGTSADEEKGKLPRALQFERTLPGSTKRDSQKPVPPDFSRSLRSNSRSSRISPINESTSQTPPFPSTKPRDRQTFSRYDLLPPSLLALARSPMVRGDTEVTGLDEELGCVSGNIAFVSRARSIVDRVVRGGEAFAEVSEEGLVKMLGLPLRASESEEEEGEGNIERGRSKGKSQDEIKRWVVEDEGLLCPSCGGVI